MAWPLVSDFSRMLQNPRIAFRDPHLQQCAIEKNALGQPKPRSGNFATVYRGLLPDGSSLALRVFNRRADERRQRYEAVSDYLRGREIASFVNFVYEEQGIRSAADGKLYPLVRMDWVPGVTLFEWARDACHNQRSAALAGGAETWLELARALAEHEVAHGDLQPANVMVDEEGRFTLVDYDCLAVPALMGQPNLEVGLPAYQHPARTAGTKLFPGLDHFSALVIYVALRALAAETSLWGWNAANAPVEYDGLLFRAEDFASPRDSALRARLLESPDEQVRDLTHYLFELARYDLHDVPGLDDVLLWCQPLGDVLAQKDWDLAVKLVESMGAAETIDEELLPLVSDAYARVAGRRALEQAIRSGDQVEILRCYQPELLAGDPRASTLLVSAQMTNSIHSATAALEADRRAGDWASFAEHWQQFASLLADQPQAQALREESERLLEVQRLRHALEQPAPEPGHVSAIWNRLEALGGHPAAAELELRARQVIAEHGRLAELKGLLADSDVQPGFVADTRLVDAWRSFVQAGGTRDPALRERVDAARSRIRRLKKLNQLAGAVTLDDERELILRARQLPANYHPKLEPRIRLASERLAALDQLNDRLSADAGEAAVAAAAARCEQLGADRFYTDWQRARVQSAIERAPVPGDPASIDPTPIDQPYRQNQGDI